MQRGVTIGSYSVVRKLADGRMSEVFLAADAPDGPHRYVIKLLVSDRISPRPEDLIRFYKEARIVASLDHPGVVKILSVGEYAGRPYLVMPATDGESLEDLIRRGRFAEGDHGTALSIILSVARALEYVHSRGILHRDIKPGNILVGGGDPLQATLIDFGLADIREFARIEGTEAIAGTFGYLSPEQCGVLKRRVDERSDLYSLGIVFFELLTGEQPFRGETVNTVIHQHMARAAVPPSLLNAAVPPVLDRVVQRLLEKDPERRYQSARGLIRDLERIRRGDTEFDPGHDDRAVRLTYETTLIGRHRELAALTSLYGAARCGRGALCVVTGESGVGKTRLVEEFRTGVIAGAGIAIEGTCFSGRNKIPYGVFKDAFGVYLKTFGTLTEHERERIAQGLRSLFPGQGEILTTFSSLARELFPPGPAAILLDREREAQRFQKTVSRLFLEIGRLHGSLVIILNDVQWIDEGSLGILRELLTELQDHSLTVVCTCRDSEIVPDQGFGRFLAEARERERPVELIPLAPLRDDEVRELVARMLQDDPERVEHLVRYIGGKARGNPFFIIEILKQLVDEKVLANTDGRWRADPRSLRTYEISPVIVDHLLKKTQLLGTQDRAVLSYAAIIGKAFSIDLLFILADDRREAVVEAVDRSIRMRLIEDDPHSKGMLQFVHDRIREAFFADLPPGERQSLHHNVARALETRHGAESDDHIFDIANHDLESGDDSRALASALAAGGKARREFANDEAIRYYEAALEILRRRGRSATAEGKACRWSLMEVCLLAGRYDEAITMAEGLLQAAHLDIETAELYQCMHEAYFKKGEYRKSEDLARAGLKYLGERLPSTRLGLVVSIVRELVIHLMHIPFARRYRRRERTRDRERHQMIIAYYGTLSWLYIMYDQVKMLRCSIRMLNLAEAKIGRSLELGTSLAAYAGVSMAIPLFNWAIRYQRAALELREDLGHRWGVAQSCQFLGFCYQWQGDYAEALSHFDHSLELFAEIGDYREIGITMNGIYVTQYFRGDHAHAVQLNERYLEISQKSNDIFGITAACADLARHYTAMGDFDRSLHYARRALDLAREKDIAFVVCTANIEMGKIFLDRREYAPALEHFQAAEAVYRSSGILSNYTVHLYALAAAAVLGRYGTAGVREARRYLRTGLKLARRWICNYPLALCVSARFHVCRGDMIRARRDFQHAIDQAVRLGQRYDEARALEDYGHWLRDQGHAHEGTFALNRAWSIYGEIGARRRAAALAGTLGIISPAEGGETSIAQRLSDNRRLECLIRVSQDISSILSVDSLIESILQKAIEVTGAEQGCIFLRNDETGLLELRARYGINNDSGGGVERPYSLGIVHDVFSRGESVLIVNAQEDERSAGFQSVHDLRLKSILCSPLRRGDRVIGVCFLENKLSSGVFSLEDRELLDVFINQAAIAVENASLYGSLEQKVASRTAELQEALRTLQARDDLISRDLKKAREIQADILNVDLRLFPGIDVVVHYQPLMEVGGDLYDVYRRRDGRYRVFLADATGHGIGAALTTMIIKSEWDRIKDSNWDPAAVLGYLNGVFCEDYRKLSEYFTGVVVDLDLAARRLRLSSAGHPEQYLIRQGRVLPIRTAGVVMGAFPSRQYLLIEEDFVPGDKLILFTDGMFEEFAVDGKELGDEGLLSIIEANRTLPVREIVQALLAGVTRWRGPVPVNDDITLVGIECIP